MFLSSILYEPGSKVRKGAIGQREITQEPVAARAPAQQTSRDSGAAGNSTLADTPCGWVMAILNPPLFSNLTKLEPVGCTD
jgi:hypothetical protein